jgi:hypothetical protein
MERPDGGGAPCVCEAVADPPFKPDRMMSPSSLEVATELTAFTDWYRARRPDLERLALRQAAEIEPLPVTVLH